MDSITSNARKLLYNADRLIDARNGQTRPIMFHVCLINACQLKCPFCCYGDRPDCTVMDYGRLLRFIDDCETLDCKTWELTGGGEPLLYPQIDQLLDTLHERGFSVGLMTNGLALDRLQHPEYLKWIRVSLHGIEQGHTGKIVANIEAVRTKVFVSACFIADAGNLATLPQVFDLAHEHNLIVKIEPNYYQNRQPYEETCLYLQATATKKPNVFVDFGRVHPRKDNRCYCHLVKPFLYTDGWLCACPLPIGETRDIDLEFHLCRMENVIQYYRTCGTAPRHHDCRFCRYEAHNEVAEAILHPLEDREFC